MLALTSAAPSLEPHKVGLSLGFVVLLTVVNLRGVRESGVLFALPTYGFVAVMFVMVGDGRRQVRSTARARRRTFPTRSRPAPASSACSSILQAFASGRAALTGVEAISNGVGASGAPRAGTPR